MWGIEGTWRKDDQLRLATDVFAFFSEVVSEETPAPGGFIPGSVSGFSSTSLGSIPETTSQMLPARAGRGSRVLQLL